MLAKKRNRTMIEDEKLMAEIKAQAEKAEEARPETIDVSVLAMTLGAEFHTVALMRSRRRSLTCGAPTTSSIQNRRP